MIDHNEEPWEAEIASMLGGLGPIDPPDGFLESAVDHRPAFSGRLLAGLTFAVLAFAAVGISTDWSAMSTRITPELSALETSHRAFGPESSDTPSSDALPPGVPDGFVVAEPADAGPWDHEVVERAPGTVSVFRQAGSLNWDGLVDGRRSIVGTTEVWVTGSGSVMFEHAGEVFVLVGLDADEFAPPPDRSVGERTVDFVEGLAEGLGHPG